MRLSVTLSVVASSVLVGSSQAGATATPGTCTSAYDGYFDGFNWNGPAQTYDGAYATITPQFGGLCAGDTGTTNQALGWSMIAGSIYCEWAQSGFRRVYVAGGGNNTFNFYQIADSNCGALDDEDLGAVTFGTSHSYEEVYGMASHHMFIKIDGTTVRDSPVNIRADWLPPFSVQFDGEDGHLESNMPGSSTAHTKFRSIQAQRWSDGTLVPFCGAAYDNSQADWNQAHPDQPVPITWTDSYVPGDCSQFDIWTK